MSNPNLIDNKRVKLSTVLDELLPRFEDLSIATGYWDLEGLNLIIDSLVKYKKVRILFGRPPLIKRDNAQDLKVPEPDFPVQDIFHELQRVMPTKDLKDCVSKLDALYKQNVLEIKVFRKNFLHAKTYIFGNEDSTEAVGVVGSSNFTYAGLTNNLELNDLNDNPKVVLFHPKNDKQEHGHLSWFNEIWNESEEWTGDFMEIVNGSNHGDLVYSPYEMYIKTLQFWYADQVEDDRLIEGIGGKTLASFQERNVKQLLSRLEKYGVAMLADSVGLGKTISAIGVIKQYRVKKQRVVVICPASLVLQWREELSEAGLYDVMVLSLQNRKDIEDAKNVIDKYAPVGLFVIDEAHNLRNSSSGRYTMLTDWIGSEYNVDNHVLLLTATPINNSLTDLSNQILLGSAGDQDILPVNYKNDQGIIKQISFHESLENIKKRLNQARKRMEDISDEEQNRRLDQIYKDTREGIDPIMRAFVVRNTRDGIEKEFKGVEIKGELKTFPKVEMLNVKFDLDSIQKPTEEMSDVLKNISAQSLEVLVETTDRLLHPRRQASPETERSESESIIELLYKVILSMSLVPYRYEMYHVDVYGKQRIDLNVKGPLALALSRQISLYGIIRTVFLKRLESSSKALKTSIEKYQRRLDLFESILLKHNKVISLGDLEDIEDEYLPEDGEQTELDLDDAKVLKMIEEKARDITDNTHNIIALKEDIVSEKRVLKELVMLADMLDRDDTKVNEYFKQIEVLRKENPNTKILTFTFFSDTVSLIQNKIIEKNFFDTDSEKFAFVSGKNKTNAVQSAKLFAPKAKNYQVQPKEKEIDFLVSTDVLAEGQNLQDCAIVVNYDLHWNPVRMIQRNGRVNRLGSDHKVVKVINMIPHTQVERFLRLQKTLSDKIEMIKATIGTDSSILGEDANPLDFTGVYSTDVETASNSYREMESKAENFTDDEFVNDLRDFNKNATEQEKNAVKYIPTGKWGELHNDDIYSLHFMRVHFDNGQDKNAIIYTQAGNYSAILDGAALRKIKSLDKNRLQKTLPAAALEITNKLQTKAEDLILFDSINSTRTIDSERKVAVLVQNKFAWSGDDLDKLSQLFRSRNVILKKKVKQLKDRINSAERNSKDSSQYVSELKLLLPSLSENPPQLSGPITQLTNFYNKNIWQI